MMIILLSAAVTMSQDVAPNASARSEAAVVVCKQAISTKGTGVAGRSADARLAIKTKGTSAHRSAAGGSADARLAIKTKGTGAQRSAAGGSADAATDCTGAGAE